MLTCLSIYVVSLGFLLSMGSTSAGTSLRSRSTALVTRRETGPQAPPRSLQRDLQLADRSHHRAGLLKRELFVCSDPSELSESTWDEGCLTQYIHIPLSPRRGNLSLSLSLSLSLPLLGSTHPNVQDKLGALLYL